MKRMSAVPAMSFPNQAALAKPQTKPQLQLHVPVCKL